MSESINIEPTHIFLADVHLGGSVLMWEKLRKKSVLFNRLCSKEKNSTLPTG